MPFLEYAVANKEGKGPGRGWWGPPAGTHVPQEGGDGGAGGSGGGAGGTEGTADTFEEATRWNNAVKFDAHTNTITAQNWGDTYLDKSQPQGERDALTAYTSNLYDDINPHLRGKLEQTSAKFDAAAIKWARRKRGATEADIDEYLTDYVDDYMGTIVEDMDSSFSGSKAPSDMIVYRGISERRAGKLQSGDEFMDHAYVSTSLVPDKTNIFGGHRLHIRVKKDTTLVWPGRHSDNRGELEVIFPRGSRFRVIRKGVGQDYDDKNYTFVEVIESGYDD